MRANLILTMLFLALGVMSVFKYLGDRIYVDVSAEPTLFDGFTPNKVGTIIIERPKPVDESKPKSPGDKEPTSEFLGFVKSEDKWVIASFPGQDQRFAGITAMTFDVESKILEKIERIKVTESTLIETGATNDTLAGFELDDKTGLKITCRQHAQGPVYAQLIVGREAGKDISDSSEAVTGVFVRQAQETDVILFEDDLDIDMDPKNWIDKSLQDIPESEVEEVTLTNSKGSISFVREKGKGWKATKKPDGLGPLREFAVTGLIGQARRVEASDFESRLPDNPQVKNQVLGPLGLWPKPKFEVTLKTKDGKSHVLRIGKEVEGEQAFYAYLSDQPLLFMLREWDVKEFEKEAKEFFDPKPPEETPDTAKKETPEEENPKKETGEVEVPGSDKPSSKDGEVEAPDGAVEEVKKPGTDEVPVKPETGKGKGAEGVNPDGTPVDAKKNPGKGASGEETKSKKPGDEVPATQPAKNPTKKDNASKGNGL